MKWLRVAIVRVACAALLSALFSSKILPQEQNPLDHLKNKMAEWQALAHEIQCDEIAILTHFKPGGDVVLKNIRIIKSSSEAALMIDEQYRDGKLDAKTAIAYNPKYGFSANHNPKGWKLGDLLFDEPSKIKSGPISLKRLVLLSQTVNYPLQMLESDQLKVLKSETSQDGGRKHLIVNYTEEMRDDNKKVMYSSLGKLRFDFDLEMSLVSVESDTRSGPNGKMRSKSKVEIEYEGKIGLFPRPVKRTVKSTATDGSGKESISESVTKYDFKLNPDVPVTEFTLSAFGLPEPRGVTWHRPTSRWIWYGLGGIVLIAFGAWTHRRKTAKSNADPAVS